MRRFLLSLFALLTIGSMCATNTVKAISALDGEVSKVVAAANSFADSPEIGFGSLFDMDDNETVIINHDATVIWQCRFGNNDLLYAFDETGFGNIYGDVGQTYKIGDVIPAGFSGIKTTYRGEPELVAPLTGFQASTGYVELTPEIITTTQVDQEHWAHYVVLKNVIISKFNNIYTLTDDDGNTCEMYNNFGIQLPTDLSVPHDVYGVVGRYNAFQVYPISFDVAYVHPETEYDFIIDKIAYKITNPNTVEVTYIDFLSNNNYNGIETINVPETVKYDGVIYQVDAIGEYAFWGCSSLRTLIVPHSICSIAANAFLGTNIKSLCIIGNGDWQAGALSFNFDTLYIGSGVTSIHGLQAKPSAIYSFAVVPPECDENSFLSYDAVLHVPGSSFIDYFMADYWCNFADLRTDAVEPASVSLNLYEAEMLAGKTMSLIATVSPDNATLNAIVWTTSDPQVAIVNNGIVTALDEGECDIVANCLDKQAVCHVTVMNPYAVTLDQTEVTIEQTQQVTLTATVTPEGANAQDFIWSTSDASVAIVDEGVVTAVGVGECDITATYMDKWAICHVTVINPVSISLDQTEVTIEQSQQVTLTATVSPEWANTQDIIWSTSDATVAMVDEGVVTAVGVGECDITATCVDKQAVCHVTVIGATIHINLDRHEARVLPNHMITLTPTMSPSETTLKVTSSDTDVAVARLVNGVVQVAGRAAGTTMVIVGSVDGTAIPDTCLVTVYTEIGDVNCDGYVNISDVTDLIDYLLSGNGDSVNQTNADCDKDSNVNIADVTTLIDYLLGGIDLNPPVTETFTVNGVSFKMVVVEGGTFTMGATSEQDDAYEDETPAHQVTLTDFCIGQTEVTQELWQAVMGDNPSFHTGNLKYPVECVNWDMAQEFITQLNSLTGLSFRLPTEAEWEFAARGGRNSKGYKHAGSNTLDAVAWYCENSDDCTHPVGTKKANELGIYDMNGNIWEWTQDWYGEYSSEAQTNPTGPSSGFEKVHRGGCFNNDEGQSRVSGERYSSETWFGLAGEGFRLAMTPHLILEKNYATVTIGEQVRIGIDNGHGHSFNVSYASEYVTCSIEGDSVIISGLKEGTTKVTIIDCNNNAKATLTVVIVNGQTFTVNGVSFTMVNIDGGSFIMGATPEQLDEARDDEYPAHQVTLSSYSIGETEVTQALWVAVMGSNPSCFQGDLNCPVEMVSWDDCQEFIARLNQMTGKTFRLPTEAEWEFAARGGNKSQGYKYAGGNMIDDVAWHGDNSWDGTHPVATKAPNELGIYDMSGNVWERLQDWKGEYSSDSQMNPTGPISGTFRVTRGGGFYCYNYFEGECRVSFRGGNYEWEQHDDMGLRLAL